jgi:glycyl-tRNA synthetase
MLGLYHVNGLVFYDEKFVRMRRFFCEYFARELDVILKLMNPAWRMIEVEAPLITPRHLLNPNYTNADIWSQESDDGEMALAMRPETTPGSYVYAQHLLNGHSGVKLPFVVWQAGKSFRREQDQVMKNVRLKEFYQQEFQCLYTADSANDYHKNCLEPVQAMLTDMISLPTRIVPSDRLPSYSQVTMDVEVWNGDKWMEICSISRRTDFPQKAVFQSKSTTVEKDIFVLEVAIGLDRCVYNARKRCTESIGAAPTD